MCSRDAEQSGCGRRPQRFVGLITLVLLLAIGVSGRLAGQDLSLANQGLFFEEPRFLVGDSAHFPRAVSNGLMMAVVYQEIERRAANEGDMYLSVAVSDHGRSWQLNRRVLGPIRFRRESPPHIFSAVMTLSGDLYVVLAESPSETRVVRSVDNGQSFQTVGVLATEVTSVSPRLSLREDGGLLLFVNQSIGATQTVLYSYSDNGSDWSSLRPLEDDPSLGFSFLPTHVSHDGREYVVFQSIDPLRRPTYELHSKYSQDGGRSWNDARPITDFVAPWEAGQAPSYDNQRPYLRVADGRLMVAWERASEQGWTRIYLTNLNRDGVRVGAIENVTPEAREASYPRIVTFAGRTYVIWFTDPFGDSRVYISGVERATWRSRNLSPGPGVSTFGSAVVNRDRLHLFWQQRRDAQRTALVYMEPDQRAAPPVVFAENFVLGRRSSNEIARFRWNPAPDPSGIVGYSWVWARDPAAPVPRVPVADEDVRSVALPTDQDGAWYFRIAAVDRAGNWSEPVTMLFERDTTPPGRVAFEPLKLDDNGFLVSNTFTIEWEPPEDDDVAGYSVSLQRVGPSAMEFDPQTVALRTPPPTIQTRTPQVSQRNLDNGLWSLSVAAIDEVGNVGETETLFLRLNKYVPVTEVHNLIARQDELGRYSVDIAGRGFTAQGTVERIIVDRDGSEPYDYVFSREAGDFVVNSDRQISNLVIDLIRSGEYRFGIDHPRRGVYFSPRTLSFEAGGTVTFGDYTVRFVPQYRVAARSLLYFAVTDISTWIVLAFAAMVVLFSSTRLAGVIQEGRALQVQAHALITGTVSPRDAREKRIRSMKQRGLGLRVKFAFFVVVLVASVVLAVAFFVGNAALQRQENILARGLEQRIEVLLESVSGRAEQLLVSPAANRIDLEVLTDQSEVMAEVAFITISGQSQDRSSFDAVWATNDPLIRGGSDMDSVPGLQRTLTTPLFIAGQSHMEDAVAERVTELEEDINRIARAALGDAPRQLDEVTQELAQLFGAGVAEDDPRLLELNNAERDLRRQINRVLSDVGSVVDSIPRFDAEDLSREQREYYFYRPVVFFQPGEDPELARYFRGVVRMGVSTDLILAEIDDARRELIISTAFVALGAVSAGIIGALLLATIVVIPIRRLVRGVEVIRDTEDKLQLATHNIEVKSRDELSVLADTINSMTQGLVKAAEANKDLVMGKEIQQMFIPLKTDGGRKLTTAYEDFPGAEFAGYYEGAKGVSGDYFSYVKLDDKHFAIIKCDVSGKGVAAALIMVQVATIFSTWFRDWSTQRRNAKLSDLVVQINDTLEQMGFKGKFAAFTLGILNMESGQIIMCNAGDNQLHIADSEAGKVNQITMPDAPAAGVFSSDMLPQGFPEARVQLKHGDVLLFFTDGVEESKRLLRNADYSVHGVTEADVKTGRVAPDTAVGVEDEEFGIARIHEVCEAVQKRGRYVLRKALDPAAAELSFDFSGLKATAENMVLALIAVEKVFRLVPDPKAGSDDRIRIDAVIDDFLKARFKQYADYFHHPVDGGDGGGHQAYRQYGYVREDEQYDDLTILAIRKK
ncbi:MAG: HAMP domain-containing protein [Spirochaetaceae bacterium]|nr:MAG: HAMP domain-containing protein [Spirochaetaceae bacterium]